jgi:hypothetical protein
MQQMRLAVVFATNLVLTAACSESPAPTGTMCPDPDPVSGTTSLTWESFGRDFMTKYCVNCHSSDLPRSKRNGAPIYHDFDSLTGVLQVANHIDSYAGAGPNAQNTTMPGERCPSIKGGPADRACPQPTLAERTNLAQWLACERLRPR